MNDPIDIPKGYVVNATGDLIKETNVSVIEREEDKLVKALFPPAEALHLEIGKYKYQISKLVNDMVERCVKQHGLKKFERIKGNLQFTSFDGKLKIQRAIDDRIEHDSSIEVAIQKLCMYGEVLKTDSGPDAAKFIDQALILKNGKYSTSKLIDTLNKDISHPLYVAARDALLKSLFVSGTKVYYRFYKLNETDEMWEAMPLQFSSIAAIAPEPETQQALEEVAQPASNDTEQQPKAESA